MHILKLFEVEPSNSFRYNVLKDRGAYQRGGSLRVSHNLFKWANGTIQPDLLQRLTSSHANSPTTLPHIQHFQSPLRLIYSTTTEMKEYRVAQNTHSWIAELSPSVDLPKHWQLEFSVLQTGPTKRWFIYFGYQSTKSTWLNFFSLGGGVSSSQEKTSCK